MTIREKTIEHLKQNQRQIINEIADAIQEKRNVVRTKLYDKKCGLIAKGEVVSVGYDKQLNYFSHKENVIDKELLLKFMYETINNKMDWKYGEIENLTDEDKSKIKKVREILQIHI